MNDIIIYKSFGSVLGFFRDNNLYSQFGQYLGWRDGDYVWDSSGQFKGKLVKLPNGYNYILKNIFDLPPIPQPPRIMPPVMPNLQLMAIQPVVLDLGLKDGF